MVGLFDVADALLDSCTNSRFRIRLRLTRTMTHRRRCGCFCWLSSTCTWLKVKYEAATRRETLDSLRCRGEWARTDNLPMFYKSYNGAKGLNYSVFLLVKAVIIGVVLCNDDGVLVEPLTKVGTRSRLLRWPELAVFTFHISV